MSETKRLLVIDDDEGICDLICFMGESSGFKSSFVTKTGHFEKVDVNKFDIIFLDLMIPDIDGIQILRFLANRNCQAWLVLISGMEISFLESAKIIAEEYNLNVLKMLSKSMNISDVETLLKNLPPKKTRSNKEFQQQFPSKKELEYAIKNDTLVPFFQPKIDLKNKEIIGVEVLARWLQLNKEDTLLPDFFIPFSEEKGLIKALTEQIVAQSLQQYSLWLISGKHFIIAFNMSSQTLNDLAFPDWLANKARVYGIKPSQIIIEVNEASLFKDLADFLDVLTRLRLKGFKLSIDNFGIDCLSMKQLKLTSFSELKIAPSFVKNADKEEDAYVICQSIIELGVRLNMSVIAKGIETESAWNLLKKLGCNGVQGHYIAKAMPAKKFEQWCGNWEIKNFIKP